MFKKNDIIPLTIESITNEGSGIGHTDGIAVFVPMTAAGDELRVRIVKVQKSYCYGIIEEVITPSPDRVPVDCPSYKRCGGCSLRHITYEAELREKQRWVQDAMRRIGVFTMEIMHQTPQFRFFILHRCVHIYDMRTVFESLIDFLYLSVNMTNRKSKSQNISPGNKYHIAVRQFIKIMSRFQSVHINKTAVIPRPLR